MQNIHWLQGCHQAHICWLRLEVSSQIPRSINAIHHINKQTQDHMITSTDTEASDKIHHFIMKTMKELLNLVTFLHFSIVWITFECVISYFVYVCFFQLWWEWQYLSTWTLNFCSFVYQSAFWIRPQYPMELDKHPTTGLPETKKLLYRQANHQQSQQTTHRMGGNLHQLCLWQRTNN